MNVYELGRVIIRLRLLHSDDRDAAYEASFTKPSTKSWDEPARPHSRKQSGCTFQWETTVPELDDAENEFFDFLAANADLLRHRPAGCVVYVEYFCYMAEPRFLVQLSAERIALIGSFEGELCVETFTRR